MEGQQISSADTQSAFNMGVATLMRMDDQMKKINNLTSSPDNVDIKTQLHLQEELITLYVEVSSFMDKEEKERINDIKNTTNDLVESTIKKKNQIERNSKIANQIAQHLKIKNLEFNLFLRKIMHKHDLLMPKRSDPRKMVTA